MDQKSFAEALLDPQLPTPDGVMVKGEPAKRRFRVYRNNVVAGLSDVLVSNFPVLFKLLGEEYFLAMAGIYVRKYPPTSPILTFYGNKLPEFLSQFPPVANYPYLPDIAHLELAIKTSYHAADSKPVKPEVIQSMSENEIENAHIELAPSVVQIRSRYPICTIWVANSRGGELNSSKAEDVLILRKLYDPEPSIHLAGGYEFVEAIKEGHNLTESCIIASEANTTFNFGDVFGKLLEHNAITLIR